jgi:hypothetical protein
LEQFPLEMHDAVREMRERCPGWGPLTIRTELEDDRRFDGMRLPSRSRIAAFLKQEDLTRKYERHSELPQPQAVEPERAHQEWEVDAQGVIQVPDLGSVSIIHIEVPSIIPRELKAQERRERNKETAKCNTKYEYLVGRRVTCGHCGNKMVGRLMSQKYWYYYCPVHKGQRVEGKCDNRYFNVTQVDKAVWSWVKELLLDPEALRRNLKVQQAKQEEANKPLHGRLAVIDGLLADNRRQLEKLLDLYLAEEFDKEMLTERKTRLEATVTALEKERAGLVTTLEAAALSDDQIMTIEDFARKVAEGLRTAEEDFEAKRRIIDLLDVQVTLAIEDGEKIAYVHCLVDEAELSIVRTTSKSLARPKVWRSSRRGWLASPEYTSRKGRGRF